MNEKQRLIASFEKNSLEKVRVHLQRWKNQTYVDIRAFFLNDQKTEHATKKGITLNVELLPQLIQALQEAEGVVEGGLADAEDAGHAPDEAIDSGPPREEDDEEKADGRDDLPSLARDRLV